MSLTEKEKAKIRQEAEALYPVVMEQYNGTPFGMFGQCDSNYYIREAHVAAVIAERERAKVLVDAAKDVCEKLEPLLPESILSSIYNTLSKALNQCNQSI